jgi:hypothetical protein
MITVSEMMDKLKAHLNGNMISQGLDGGENE